MTATTPITLTPAQALELVPQQHPFRFVDRYLELDAEHAVSEYRYREDEFFYRGHFPDYPLTPGVILLETMNQATQGIYFFRKAKESGLESMKNTVAVFTDAQIDVMGQVRPGEKVTCRAELIYFRMGKMKSKVEMRKEDGSLVAVCTASGVSLPK